MGQYEQRAAKRVTCEFPLRLGGAQGPLVASACDLSRTGIRITLPGRVLGVHRLSSLVQVARRVNTLLGDAFIGELHHERLGGLVRKTLKPVRIGHRDWENTDVELGCRISEGITDEEAGMLGVALPQIGAEEAPAHLVGAAPEVRKLPTYEDPVTGSVETEASIDETPELPGVRGTDRHRVYVKGRDRQDAPPFVAMTESFAHGGAVLRILDIGRMVAAEDADDVSRFMIAFDALYGEHLSLRVMDGARHVWSGPAEVRTVELPPESPGQAILTVSYARSLRAAELREFGLA